MAATTVAIESPPMVASGSRVVIVVSTGSAPLSSAAYVNAPALVGKQQGRALAELQDADFSAQVFNDYSETMKRGSVIAQLPPAGSSAAAGSGAVLLVSSGPALAPARMERLPDVVGDTEPEAVERLQSAGFSPQVVRESHAAVPAGIVIAQLPSQASLAVKPAARSMRWIIIGAVVVVLGVIGFFLLRPISVAVPDITGSSQAAAQAALQAAELRMGSIEQTQSDVAAEGTVVSQTPPAGTKAPKGSAVDVVVVGAEPPVSVPEVRSENQPDATRMLTDLGLQVSVTRASSPGVDKGLVMEQSPAAGSTVPKGTTVSIVISDGPRLSNVAIPDVTGLTRTDAENTLKEADLKVVFAENPSDDVAVDVVVSEYPVAAQSVPPGTTVALVVSTGPSTTSEFEIPNVVGMTLAQAQQVITDAGLEALPVAATSDKSANEIVAQTPATGEKTQAGSTVVLFYSAGQ